MNKSSFLNTERLRWENSQFRNTGGVSQCNRALGFRPAFRDEATGTVYLSCFDNGRPAPIHLLDALPDEVVVSRNPAGGVATIKDSVVSGFVRGEQFLTRTEAATLLATSRDISKRIRH